MNDDRTSRGQMPAWLDRGILVYGPRKGGTTLFQNLLDGTSQLMVYPTELKLKYFARNEAKTHDIASYYQNSRIATLKSSRFDSEDYERRWAETLRQDKLTSLDEFIRFDAFIVAQCINGPASS